MASTTAEVMLYFGSDDPKLQAAITQLRFIAPVELTTREIIDILGPVWSVAYNEGYADGAY